MICFLWISYRPGVTHINSNSLERLGNLLPVQCNTLHGTENKITCKSDKLIVIKMRCIKVSNKARKLKQNKRQCSLSSVQDKDPWSVEGV